ADIMGPYPSPRSGEGGERSEPGWGLSICKHPTPPRPSAATTLPAVRGRDKPASARLVARLRALRPRRVLGHVVLGCGFKQRTHLVLHGCDPVGDLDPFGPVPLLHEGRMVPVVILARHVG